MKKSSCSQLCSWLAAVTLLVFSVLVACPRLAAQAQSPQPAEHDSRPHLTHKMHRQTRKWHHLDVIQGSNNFLR